MVKAVYKDFHYLKVIYIKGKIKNNKKKNMTSAPPTSMKKASSC